MENLVILGVILIVFLFYKYFAKLETRNSNKKLDTFLKKQDFFNVDFKNIDVEGLSHSENVAVDIYDKELNSYDEVYVTLEGFDFRGKFHKIKNVTRFSSKIILSFEYKQLNYSFKLNDLPVDDITLRMKLYQQSFATIFVFKSNFNQAEVLSTSKNGNKINVDDFFFLDLRFLKKEEIGIIKLGAVKS